MLNMFFHSVLILAEKYKWALLMLHLFGFGVGLGAVTVTDILFFKFLKDLKISKLEADILRTLSRVIWCAFAVLVVSGVGLYLPQAAELNHSGKFLAKMLVVAVILLNGLFLNVAVSPNYLKYRKLAYASGAISLGSWYYASVLGMAKNPTLGFWGLILVYLFIVGAGVLISQIFERANSKEEI